MLLPEMPTANDFYQNYWGKKPFVVRGAIAPEVFDELIDGDTLAALSMEEDVKSRLVLTNPDTSSDEKSAPWRYEHGPFDDKDFAALGSSHWSLMVQNVEQYHIETAALLQHFNFAPRWLMDDIMISYSAPEGSVGPHMDSYHVFLVQGQGKRRWKIGSSPVRGNEIVNQGGHQILKNGFDGEAFDVTMGDIIYIPPRFAHEGVTLEEAMTFSVGFLGPKLSELLVEYGQYLELQDDAQNIRYVGQGLTSDSAAFVMDNRASTQIQDHMLGAIGGAHFSQWLAQYFSTPSHNDIENIELREDGLSADELVACLQDGEKLYRAEYVKWAVSNSADGGLHVAVYGYDVAVQAGYKPLITHLNTHDGITPDDIEGLGGMALLQDFIVQLYMMNVLDFEEA